MTTTPILAAKDKLEFLLTVDYFLEQIAATNYSLFVYDRLFAFVYSHMRREFYSELSAEFAKSIVDLYHSMETKVVSKGMDGIHARFLLAKWREFPSELSKTDNKIEDECPMVLRSGKTIKRSL